MEISITEETIGLRGLMEENRIDGLARDGEGLGRFTRLCCLR